MPADTNNSGLGHTGHGQKDSSQIGSSQASTDQRGADTDDRTSNASAVVNPAKNINSGMKTGVNAGKNSTEKSHAHTAENENTTEADLVLNEDLNSTNDI